MISIGLIPSHTGEPDGNQVGQKISDYPEKKGLFIKACKDIVKSKYLIKWLDRQPSKQLDSLIVARSYIEPKPDEILTTPVANLIKNFNYEIKPKKLKAKYRCDNCGLNVWGKENLNLSCVSCNMALISCK